MPLFSSILLSPVEENLRDEVEEYSKNCRGKELPGFVNYRTFENMVKKHIQEMEEPAIELLRNTIGKYKQHPNVSHSTHAFKALLIW